MVTHFNRFSLACKTLKDIFDATLFQRVQTKMLHTTRLGDLQKCHQEITVKKKKKKKLATLAPTQAQKVQERWQVTD